MADQKFNISFIIGAVDNVTATVAGINNKITKSFEPFQKIGKSFGNLGTQLGLGKISAALSEVGQKGKAVFNEMIASTIKLTAVVGALGFAFKEIVLGFANSAEEIQNVSDRLGISTRNFQVLQYAATQSGVSLKKLEPALTKFSLNLGESAEGTTQFSRVMQSLGVSIKDSKGNLLSMDAILPKLADRLSKIKDPALRNKIAVELFGKEGVKFAQILQGGAEGLEKFAKEADDLGLILGEDAIKAGADFNNQWEAIGLMMKNIRDVIGIELVPVFKTFLIEVAKAFKDSKPTIILFAKALGEALPSVLQTLIGVFKLLLAILTPVIFAVGKLLDFFGAANVIVVALAGFIFGKLVVSIYALMGVLVKLGIVAAANPIGLIAIGIGLVIAAIVALIHYWEPIKTFFLGIYDSIKDVLDIVLTFLSPLYMFAKAGAFIYEHWQPIKELFASIGESISNAAGAVGGFLGLGGNNAVAPGGNALGAAGVAQGITNTQINKSQVESKFVLDINGLPQGSRIKQEKADAPVDLNMGYVMATP